MLKLQSGAFFYLVVLSLLFTGQSFAEKVKYQSPASVAGTITTSLSEAKALHDNGVIFVDVRNPRFYGRGHIKGAIHLDYKYNFNLEKLAGAVKKDQPVVIYCSGATCSRSSNASEKAVTWGFTKVHYFRGGIKAWRKAGYPEQKKPAK